MNIKVKEQARYEKVLKCGLIEINEVSFKITNNFVKLIQKIYNNKHCFRYNYKLENKLKKAKLISISGGGSGLGPPRKVKPTFLLKRHYKKIIDSMFIRRKIK
jgi:hypothetical protein